MGSFWSLTGAVLARSLGLVASVVAARLLGKEAFGQLAVLQNSLSTLAVAAAFGLGLTATKQVAEDRNRDPGRAGRVIGLVQWFTFTAAALTTALLFIWSEPFAKYVLGRQELSPLWRVCVLGLAPAALHGVQLGALNGLEAFKVVARMNAWVGLVNFAAVLGGIRLARLLGAVWATTLTQAVACQLSYVALRQSCAVAGIPRSAGGAWREWRLLWEFSLPAWLGTLTTGPVLWAGQLLLARQQSGYAELGVYNAVLRIKQIPEMGVNLLLLPVLPVLTEAFGRRAGLQCQQSLRYATAVSLGLIGPVSVLLLALPDAALAVYGQQFVGASAVVGWLMLHCMAVGLFQPYGIVLTSMNRMWFGWAFNTAWAALFFGGAVVLVPRYGAAGLAAALAGSYWISSLACVVYLHRVQPGFFRGTGLATNIAVVCGAASLAGFGAWSGSWLIAVLAGLGTAVGLAWYSGRQWLCIATAATRDRPEVGSRDAPRSDQVDADKQSFNPAQEGFAPGAYGDLRL